MSRWGSQVKRLEHQLQILYPGIDGDTATRRALNLVDVIRYGSDLPEPTVAAEILDAIIGWNKYAEEKA